ncbi:hypothetical protein AJ78_00892 [Emergomyces pasteurianus Ep9510]|uniref:Uncharacterized protein n=1 Tax=Emergomyces pasteurianus Ep9510 TaxID=1447872 RepID=A0A1J9PT75_9EURO|nr:hypothetical protein AJ78_00892 [Emergomyces pasteurianus Ep9510]
MAASVDPHHTTDFPSRTEEAATATKQDRLQPTKSDPAQSSSDPFASQRTPDNDPFARSVSAEPDTATSPSSLDRRMSKEWDAAKVPPSRFQRREGSIFSTSSSRDSHITRKDRDSAYHAKLKEKVSLLAIALLLYLAVRHAGVPFDEEGAVADYILFLQGWM